MRGCNSGTPRQQLSLIPGWWAQKRAIAASHQSSPALDQADNSATQIMCFPGAIRYALLAK